MINPAVDLEKIHEHVHEEHKQRMTEAVWDAAVQRAHVLERDRIITEMAAWIAELESLLDEATEP